VFGPPGQQLRSTPIRLPLLGSLRGRCRGAVICSPALSVLGHAFPMLADDEEWLDPEDQMGLWEYQLYPLTVADLRRALDSLSDDLPVEVEFYDGSAPRKLRPMHIDLKGDARQASAFVITAH